MHSKNELPEPLLYTMDEAACVLSVSRSTLRRWIKDRKLKTVRPSIGTVRITRDELESFVSEGRGASYQTPPDGHTKGGNV